jgi:hypothetical protein
LWSWETPSASIRPLADFGPVREIKLDPGGRSPEVLDKKAQQTPGKGFVPRERKGIVT